MSQSFKNQFPIVTASILILILLNSCGSSLPSAFPGKDKEAHEQALKYVEAQLTKCGDSYYGIRKIARDGNLYQFKNPKVTVTSEQLTQADKLNGIEWKGSLYFSAEAWRNYYDGQWSEWRQNFMGVTAGLSGSLVKKNGEWQVAKGLKPDSFERIDCSNIPR